MRKSISHAELKRVLELHSLAYRFLRWLDEQATDEPELLRDEIEAMLRDRRRCASLLARDRDSYPADIRPRAADTEAFAALLSSFFQTSFHIERMVWEGRIVRARIVRGPAEEAPRAARRRRHGGDPRVEALQRIVLDDALGTSKPELIRAAKDRALRGDLVVWTYAVGLVRRARGRAEGRADWKLWNAMPGELRRNLTITAVWEARGRLASYLAERG